MKLEIKLIIDASEKFYKYRWKEQKKLERKKLKLTKDWLNENYPGTTAIVKFKEQEK